MHSLSILKQIIKNVMANVMADKMRTFLTCLGMMIGTASLICMMTTFVLEKLDTVADDKANGYYYINLYWYNDYFTQGQLDTFRQMDNVAGMSPVINPGQKIRVKNRGKLVKDISIQGFSSDYYLIGQSANIVEGSAFSKEDELQSNKVCILNQTLAKQLFGKDSPVGQKISISGVEFEIVGVSQKYKDSSKDKTISIPYTTVQKLYGSGIDDISIYPKSNEVAAEVDLQVREYMNQIAKTTDAYTDSFDEAWLVEGDKSAAMQALVQYSVAVIAMLIGGIGIMNMMLVMVTERTVEIGLRKALGATPRRIQLQFIAESIIISLLGGGVGVLLGIIGSAVICMSQSHGFVMNPVSILVSLAFALSVGVFFGWMPAKSASKLNVIDALKSE